MPKIINGVLNHPKVGRLSSESGTVCVGPELQRAIEAYNSTASEDEKVPSLPYSAVTFSHKIGKATEDALATSRLGKYVGTHSYQQIQTALPNHVFLREMVAVKAAICQKYPIVALTVDNWASKEAIKNKLVEKKRQEKQKASSEMTKPARYMPRKNVRKNGSSADELRKGSRRTNQRSRKKKGADTTVEGGSAAQRSDAVKNAKFKSPRAASGSRSTSCKRKQREIEENYSEPSSVHSDKDDSSDSSHHRSEHSSESSKVECSEDSDDDVLVQHAEKYEERNRDGSDKEESNSDRDGKRAKSASRKTPTRKGGRSLPARKRKKQRRS